jgi:hypothetical protein
LVRINPYSNAINATTKKIASKIGQNASKMQSLKWQQVFAIQPRGNASGDIWGTTDKAGLVNEKEDGDGGWNTGGAGGWDSEANYQS